MTAQPSIPLLSVSNLTASKTDHLFKTLKWCQFNSQLVLMDSNKQKWVFNFYQGYIVYATGGIHPVRRWVRNLATYCPQMLPHIRELRRDLSGIDAAVLNTCWEYQLLCLWVEQQKITGEQATKMIRAILTEVLFDIAQTKGAINQFKQDSELSTQLVWIDPEQAITEVDQYWQIWQKAKLADYSPNCAPIIRQPEQLQKQTSEPVYQTLCNFLNGRNTLRDVAAQIKQDVWQVTQSLLPYIQLGFVELINIPDLPSPVPSTPPQTPARQTEPTKPVIACVDDSLWVCQTMEQLLTSAGYQFVGVNDPMRAIAILLAQKPDLIFLDLVMPNTNGYEICSQLRKLSLFSNTPIVILTGNDGIVDQVRARLFGASDFLSKPIDSETVLKVIIKHLGQREISPQGVEG